MKFYFKREKEKEEVDLENWVWAVVYKDGSELHQFEPIKDSDEGIFHQIGEVKQEDVYLFVLYTPDMAKRIDIVVPEGARLIHKYKHYVFNANTEAEVHHKIYVFGYKLGEHYHFNFVMPNGTIIQSNNENLELSNFGLN